MIRGIQYEDRVSEEFYNQASRNSARRRTVLRTVAAAVVDTVQAPPAITLRQDLQSQIPTADRLTVSLPQKVQV